jgi:transcriptional regulator with XRE-family HTH domain
VAERRHGLARIQVAATLRRMREQAGVTREAAARELYCTASKIGDIETGRSAVKPIELEKLLELYGVTGADRDELIDTARNSRRTRRTSGPSIPSSEQRHVDLEAQARSLTFFSPELLPGFLQTDGYARALLEWSGQLSATEVEQRLALRAERRKILTRSEPAPPSCWCILGEAALRSNSGGPVVMAEQLAHLVECSRTMRHLVIQVLPLRSGVHGFMGQTVTLMRFDPPAPNILHADTRIRNVFFDAQAEVDDTTAALDLMKAKAIGRDESLTLINKILLEYQEMSGHGALE